MTDPNSHIITPRLYLSYFVASNDAHCDFLVNLYNTPEFIASIGGSPTSITTTAAARQYIEGRFQAEHSRNGYGTYLVSLKPDSPAMSSSASFAEMLKGCMPIGTVSLTRGVAADAYKATDIGFAIIPELNGKGYATEAARALIDYAQQNLGVDAVFGFFAKGNTSSRRVVEKLGFEDRGVRSLKNFGGAESEVWTLPGMDANLEVYGL
jgi:RimJ/RimL family protein N-acetyltransferase